jgi:hypothetical protein
MPSVIVEVGSLYGEDQIGICFKSHNQTLSFKCGHHPMTVPFKGTELTESDISHFMTFFFNSLEMDSHEKRASDMERFEECNSSGTEEDLQIE